MHQVAGLLASTFTWGTFIWLLLPSTIIGVLLGLAEYRHQTEGRRWLIWCPLLFISAIIPQFDFLFSMASGGGATAGHRRRLRLGRPRARLGPSSRSASGVVVVFVTRGIMGPDMGPEMRPLWPSPPRGAWVGTLFMSFAIINTTTKDMNKVPTQAPRGVERAKAVFISGPISGPMVPLPV